MSDQPETRERGRFPLAFDAKGDPIKLPPNARSWRVKRGGGRRGRPRTIFRDGNQLEIPIGAGLDELIAAECPSDRYLLYAVDDQGCIISGVVAVTEVPPGYEEETMEEPSEDAASGSTPNSALLAALQTIQKQSESLCNALSHTTSGYSPVRPPPPMAAIEQAAALMPTAQQAPESPADAKAKIELVQQVMTMAAYVYNLFKNSGIGGTAAPAATSAGPPMGDVPGGGAP
jgi:hypothetical protein